MSKPPFFLAIARTLAACSAFVLASCAWVLQPESSRLYINPVMDQDFPDPAVIRTPDGWYYAYATQTTLPTRSIYIQVARSRDLVRWEHLGEALQKPAWASRNFWAPDVSYDTEGARYLMYYSAQPDGRQEFCLAVAVSPTPAGPYVDSGTPLACGQEHIDPMAFDDPRTGKRFLYWGFRSIRVQELASDRMRFAPGSTPIPIMLPGQEREYSEIVEGPWVTYRDGKYFLFFSGDHCCGPQPSYAVMVARADGPTGPFIRLGEADASERSVILERNASWRAPGHNAVIRDSAGVDWLLYHAVDPRRPVFEALGEGKIARRVLLLDRLEYRDGWPRVARAQPSTTPQRAPVTEGNPR